MTKGEKKTAILVMVTGFALIYLVYREMILLYIAITIALASLMSNKLTDLIVASWYKIGELLGWINSRIILAVIYYLFLFPLSLLSKMSRKDSLQLKDSGKNSLFTERNHQFKPGDFEKIW